MNKTAKSLTVLVLFAVAATATVQAHCQIPCGIYNDEARFAELRAAAVNAPRVDEIWYPDIDHGLVGVERQVARDLSSWMTELGLL